MPKSSRFKHGLSRIAEYRAWQTMRLRCLNPKNHAYQNYGGRGITVCDSWKDDFLAFLKDMGRKPSPDHELDRKDNDKGYGPGNCRWVTRSVNDRNRRNNCYVSFRGERRLLIELCEQFGVRKDTVRFRMKSGMTLEQALTTPVRPKAPNGKGKDRIARQTDYFLTEELKQVIFRLAQEGLGAREINKQTGMSRTHIRRLLTGNMGGVRAKRKKCTVALPEEVAV